jgi:hypothetical protein
MRNIPDALFGSHSVIIDRTTMKATPARADNGLWIGLHGPKYKRVSAVLFFRQLTPWSLASCDIELWHNPWADKPFEIVWLPVAQRVPNRLTGEMQKIVVKSTAELFDLEAEWPGED